MIISHYISCTDLCKCDQFANNMPHFVTEPEGYRYLDFRNGIVMYNVEPPQNTHKDEIAFGFMTWFPNGTLVRLDAADSKDYIHIFLVGRLG